MYKKSRKVQGIHKKHTVNCNSNTLRQFITVCADERGYSSKLVDLQIVCAQRPFANICVHNLEVELVGSSYSSNGCRPWVGLPKAVLAYVAENIL